MTIATIRRVPVDLIIHSLAERFDPSKNDGAEEFTDNALSLGLYACIDSNGLAEEWAVSGGVAQTAEWLATVITGRDSWREPTAAETRVAEVAVCKRILATACNLCVTQDAEDHTAATALVQAASRILGVDEWRNLCKSSADAALSEVKARNAATATIAKVRAIFDEALGTTKGAKTFTLEDVAECMVLQRARFKQDNEAAEHVFAKVRTALGWEMGMGPLSEFAVELRKRSELLKRERDNAIIERDSANLGRHMTQQASDKAIKERIAERDEAIKQRDAHAATIENLRRIIAESVSKPSAPVAKPRPQPGDVVPWAEVEDGALYFNENSHGAKFLTFAEGLWFWLYDADDRDLVRLLRGAGCSGAMIRPSDKGTTLVARDLGIDPETWRQAMREWTANGNKPSPMY